MLAKKIFYVKKYASYNPLNSSYNDKKCNNLSIKEI